MTDSPPRKDRLVQTRVPRDLEDRLKDEARRQRLSVSQFVRHLLEDTLDLVDGVLTNVDDIVADSVGLADRVRRDAARVVKTARKGRTHRHRRDVEPAEDGAEAASPRASDDALDEVVAWNPVVINRPTPCSRCQNEMRRGQDGYVGVGESAGSIAAWLCSNCIEEL